MFSVQNVSINKTMKDNFINIKYNGYLEETINESLTEESKLFKKRNERWN